MDRVWEQQAWRQRLIEREVASSQWSIGHHQRLSILSCLFAFQLPVEHRPSPKTFHTDLSLCLSAPSEAQAITKDFPYRPVSLPFISQRGTGHHQRLSIQTCLFAFQFPVGHRPSPETFHTVLSLCLSAPIGGQAITKDFPYRPVSLPFSSQWSTGHYQRLSILSCLFAFQLPVGHRPSPETFHTVLSLCLGTGHHQRLSIPSCLFAFQLPVEHRTSPKTFHTVLSLCLSVPRGAQAITRDFPYRPVSLPLSFQWSTGHHQRLSIPPCLFAFKLQTIITGMNVDDRFVSDILRLD
ncbi:LOW QUALITY PROTEIN: hypothetical protein PoB_007073800 [Plakobranchus ocellatus]|uniref:Uncharacterized protein n=1 Tax=Plakobranchus ocellatus TaxID=259542 RepID=A0AAV4DJ27_9GAST|nr:LOW QUALITY PROTEIN: hypothetical protein PoB_007073800 [Plakobranchus ocellatus]